jgi:hypothetical protein
MVAGGAQNGVFRLRFLHSVFAKTGLPASQSFGNFFDRMGLGDGNKLNFFWLAVGSNGRLGDLVADSGQPMRYPSFANKHFQFFSKVQNEKRAAFAALSRPEPCDLQQD